jgi:hypothetical protein
VQNSPEQHRRLRPFGKFPTNRKLGFCSMEPEVPSVGEMLLRLSKSAATNPGRQLDVRNRSMRPAHFSQSWEVKTACDVITQYAYSRAIFRPTDGVTGRLTSGKRMVDVDERDFCFFSTKFAYVSFLKSFRIENEKCNMWE